MAPGAYGAIRRRWRKQFSLRSGSPTIRSAGGNRRRADGAAATKQVLAEVKKTSRAMARSATRVITGEQGAQRSVVVERRVVRRFGNDKRTGT